MKNNTEIKQKIFAAGLKMWQVADEIGIHPTTLTVWLRHELTDEQYQTVSTAIEKLKAKRKEA